MEYSPLFTPETFIRAESLWNKLLKHRFPNANTIADIVLCDSLVPWQNEPLSPDKKLELHSRIEDAREKIAQKRLDSEASANRYMDWLELRFDIWLKHSEDMRMKYLSEVNAWDSLFCHEDDYFGPVPREHPGHL